MLYLETPAGVGFSYSIDTDGYDAVNDAITGRSVKCTYKSYLKAYIYIKMC